MLIELGDEVDYVNEHTSTTCEFHKRQPWAQTAGCTCSFGISRRPATPEERAENIKRRDAEMERRRKHMADYDAGKIK